MSFQNQGFWVAKGTGTVNDGEVNDDGGSRNDHKRSHLWYMDGSEADIFPNKKHVAGIPSNNIFTGMINSNISPWGNASSFHSMSGHFADRLFDSETARTANFDVRNMPSVGEEKVDMERKLEDGQFSNNSSFGLSMSSALEDPRSGVNYGGIRKVKVSQVKESESATMPVSLEHAYSVMENSAVPVPNPYNKSDENNISMGLAYNKVDGGIMSIGNSYERDNNNIFMSMGQPYSKGDDGASMNQTYNGSDDTLSISHTFSKGDENFISMGQNYDKADENAISMAHVYSKGHDVPISMTQDGSNSVSIVQSYSKGESTMISFGSGYDDDDRNPSGRLISSYELMMAQPSLETSAALSDKRLPKSNPEANAVVADAVASGTDNASKRKEDSRISKKVPANSFPSNVRSLLSTGMLDGVPVKYIAWSREKELRGVIKGSGYLCGCQTCNFSKVINAYEFERHANCKTKHPNNHIYFENGKTIYGIVQELRSTPQNILFDVIQTITGSPINLKSFRIWKESFLAATRELQRIYGKDEGKPL